MGKVVELKPMCLSLLPAGHLVVPLDGTAPQRIVPGHPSQPASLLPLKCTQPAGHLGDHETKLSWPR